MKTKGALIWEFNQPWSIEEIEIGDPVKDEVKIQMEARACATRTTTWSPAASRWRGFPVLGGHEGAGIVTEVGPGVEDLAPGDHVVLSFIPSCGQCPSCQAGMRNLCDLGCTAAQRRRGLRRHLPHPRQRQARLPDDAARHLQPVHGGAQELGGEDRPVDPVRGGLPGGLRCDDRLRLGRPDRRHPPRRRTSRSSASAASACRRCRARSTQARATSSSSSRWSGSVTQALKFGATHVYPDIDAAHRRASPRPPRA